MAVTDSYATAAEYRAGIDQDDTAEDPELLLYLTAISRLIDRRVGRSFNQDAAVVERLYAHPGGGETVMIDDLVPVHRGASRLWVDDISTVTGLIVKVDLNRDYVCEQTLTIDTDFWVGPQAAALGSEVRPYTYLDLHPNTTYLSAWPTHERSISVTAKFGWAAVPEAIKRLTIALAKQLRDVSKEPYTLTLDALEQRLPLTTGGGVKMLDQIVREYGRKEALFA